MSRINCPKCQRPDNLCYCDSIRPVNNHTRVSIIQHPNEVNHPFNTARIAQLALASCDLLCAETLSTIETNALNRKGVVLLYPDLPWLPTSPELPSEITDILVIDANWKKSKKILHLNPVLQTLPRISLSAVPSTNYKIRKTTQAGGLATIEAISHILKRLDGISDDVLLTPFHTMIERQQKVAIEKREQI